MENRSDAIIDAILAYLTDHPGPQPDPAIRRTIPGDAAAKSAAIRRLVETGGIVRSGRGGKDGPVSYALAVSGASASTQTVLAVGVRQ